MSDCIDLFPRVTEGNFTEAGYLASNPDVRRAVERGRFASGRAHFEQRGRREIRPIFHAPDLEPMRTRKMERLQPLLRTELPHRRRGAKYDFLTAELADLAGIKDTENVSSNQYDPFVLQIIADHADGLVLDCGAGRRDRYYANVVNFEIVDYESTDVLGVGECLPFKDDSFDAVVSLAVLEHVRDPFACAREISRVLKPGGRLACAVPFLQPLHGYPNHYFNMTEYGLRELFVRDLTIESQFVAGSMLPIWSLTWIVQSWARGLPEKERKRFLSRRLSDLMADPVSLMSESYVTALPDEKNRELASGTYLFARKPQSDASQA